MGNGRGKPWTPEDKALLRKLVETGISSKDIAQRLDRSVEAVMKKSQLLGFEKRRMEGLPWSDQEERDAAVLSFHEFRHFYPNRTYDAYFSKRSRTRLIVEGLTLTDYETLVSRVDGDAVICACVHVPQTDPQMWARALAVGQRDRIPTLIVAGDIVVGDMFSKWETKEEWTWDKELESLRLHISQALRIFERIVITPGNHVTNRIVRVTGGHIRLRHIIEMAGLSDAERERVVSTEVDFLDLRSGDERFLVGHASNYSNIDGRVSVSYAEKYECHVITGNGHRYGHQVSKSGRWHGWDIGTMADPRYMGYANSALTKFPVMRQSFVTVRNGAVRMYAAGPPVTDWMAELRLP